MKISLTMEMTNIEEIKELKGITDLEIEEELEQMLFEVCEDWVLRGQKPDLEVEK